MPRKKKQDLNTKHIPNIDEIDFSKPNPDIDKVEITRQQYADFINMSTVSVNQMLNKLSSINSSSYNPILGQDTFQDMNNSPHRPTQQQLAQWMSNPTKYAKNLRDVGQYIENLVMQYKRSIKHFSSILTFDYELLPLDKMPKDNKNKNLYMKSYESKLEILKKLRLKYQLSKVNESVVQDGVAFYYVKESDFITLFPLPRDYCYITGVWDLGYTFALDLTWFDRMQGMEKSMPELYQAYKMFCDMRDYNISQDELVRYQYYPLNIDEGWAFTFDAIHADCSPPLKGIFQDAMEIISYKNLLKQKTTLDTISLIAQKIPYDKDKGKFIMEYEDAQKVAYATQSRLPQGAKTIVTPFEPQQFNFTTSQSQNNIIGLGEELYWKSIGVSGLMMGDSGSSALALKYSLQGDVGFIDHMYRQYENFVYVQLNKRNSKYKWAINMFGNRYSKEEDVKLYQSGVQGQNMPVSKLYALHGYEPFHIKAMIDLENEIGIKDISKAIISGSQMSGKDTKNQGGREKSDDNNLSDSGAITREYDSNANSLKV